MFDLMLYPLFALLGIAILSGPYGCQMIWHRLACLGDALSHGALLGLSFGMIMNLPKGVSLFVLSVIWALFLWLLTRKKKASTDTILAFLTQSSMALAILFYAFDRDGSAPLMHAFLGDVLLTAKSDVLFIFGLDIVLGIILVLCWKKWLLIAIDRDLAAAQKFSVSLYTFLFFASIGFFVAESMQYLGALLAPAFFVMPPLIARPLSNTPIKMAVFSSLIAVLSACLGVVLSYYFDLPTGAAIIAVNLSLYCLEFFVLFIKKMLIKKAYDCEKLIR